MVVRPTKVPPAAGAMANQNRLKTGPTRNRSKTTATATAATANSSRNKSMVTPLPATTTTAPPTTTKTILSTTNRPTSSDKEKLRIELIPLFHEYQTFCVTTAANTNDNYDTTSMGGNATVNDNTIDHDDDKHHNSSSSSTSTKIQQRRNHLVNQILRLVGSHNNTSVTSSTVPTHQPISINSMEECFIHIWNCTIASVFVSSNNASSSSSSSHHHVIASTAIVELLLSTVVAMENCGSTGSSNGEGLVKSMLPLLCQFSECPSDAIRIVSVRALCYLAELLGNKTTATTCIDAEDDRDASEQLRLDRLDMIQQALLPRFTDKAITVRCAVVQACFPTTTLPQQQHSQNPLRTDPDLLQAVQWMVQHDPSPNNRMIAIRHVPFHRTSMEYLIPRIRDTKMNVRVAVIAALSNAVLNNTAAQPQQQPFISDHDTDVEMMNQSEPSTPFLLPSRHIAEIITAGYTDRCMTTKEAIRQMICTSWIKAAKYNPVTMLQWVNVMDHPTVATTILQIWLDVSNDSPQWFQEEVQETDQQQFRDGLQDAIQQFTIHDVISDDSHHVVERLFIARNLLQIMTSDFDKDMIWSNVVPDIPALCQVLEALTTKLVHIISSQPSHNQQQYDNNTVSENEENMTFLCLELLQLASINAKTMEEGSRRVLTSAIKGLLSNVVTPDDLLEGCMMTLKQLYESDDHHKDTGIEMEILSVIQQLSNITTTTTTFTAVEDEFFHVHTSIRIVSLITVVLEARDTTKMLALEAMDYFLQCVRPVISHTNRLLRQAAVRTLGLLSLQMTLTSKFEQQPNVVMPDNNNDDDITSLLLDISCNETEEIEIRIQAMFAVTDWVMLQFRNGSGISNIGVFESLCSQVDQILLVPAQFSQGTTCCAAEIATKLILTIFMDKGSTLTNENQTTRIHTWLARLIALYFDCETIDVDDMDECDEDVSQVGHPVRLQQLLSVFFHALSSIPALSHSSAYLLESITPMMTMLLQQQPQKKSSKSSSNGTLRWTRPLDFIVSAVSSCNRSANESEQTTAKLPHDTTTPADIGSHADANSEIPMESESDNDRSIEEENVPESTPGMVASVQVATFLSEHGSAVGVTIRRALCKWISNQLSSLDLANELWEDLSRLKEILEELVDNDGIDDASSRRTLVPVLQMLRTVESDDDEDDDAEEVEEESDDKISALPSNATSKITIGTDTSTGHSVGNENVFLGIDRTAIPSSEIESKTTTTTAATAVHPVVSDKNRALRAQCRLRPSN